MCSTSDFYPSDHDIFFSPLPCSPFFLFFFARGIGSGFNRGKFRLSLFSEKELLSLPRFVCFLWLFHGRRPGKKTAEAFEAPTRNYFPSPQIKSPRRSLGPVEHHVMSVFPIPASAMGMAWGFLDPSPDSSRKRWPFPSSGNYPLKPKKLLFSSQPTPFCLNFPI